MTGIVAHNQLEVWLTLTGQVAQFIPEYSRDWCEENTISPSKYYYWLRAIRNESLVLAGKSLAVPDQQFTQVRIKEDEQEASVASGTCAVLKSGAFSLEINNGADLKVLEHTLRIIGNLC